MSEEKYDILDENGHYTGKTKSRSLVHRDGDWHRTAHIWVMNPAGELLLQRRSPEKDSYPNMLDISAAGHIAAGEEPVIGALRELQEELGITARPEDLTLLGTIKAESLGLQPGYNNNEFTDLYLYRTTLSADEMTPQPEEVSEIFFVPFAKLKAMVENHQPDLLPHGEEYELLMRYIEEH